MLLVDTNVISELLKKECNQSVLAWTENNDFLIPAPVLAEIQSGISACPSESRRIEFQRKFDGLMADYGDFMQDWDVETALTWGKLSVSPEVRRQPQALWDSLIDDMGIRYSAVIVTRNWKDFRHSETLDPWTGLKHLPETGSSGKAVG
jgi:toxin FitB